MSRIDDALRGTERISFYLRHYENLCNQKGIAKYAELAETFRVYSIEEFDKQLKTEATQFRNQVERGNLFYQAKLNTYQAKLNANTVTIAIIALIVSALSILLSVIGLIFK